MYNALGHEYILQAVRSMSGRGSRDKVLKTEASQATLTPPRKPSPPIPKPWDHPLPDFLAFAIFQKIETYTQLALP